MTRMTSDEIEAAVAEIGRALHSGDERGADKALMALAADAFKSLGDIAMALSTIAEAQTVLAKAAAFEAAQKGARGL
jgi:hypothetical protein